MDIFKKLKIVEALKNCEEKACSNQVFNANQCKNLVYHLSNFIQRFQEIFELDTRALEPLLKDVCKVTSKVEMLVESCSQTWPLAPLLQMQNKEAFREVLLEMAACLEGLFDIASNIDSCLKEMENIVAFQSCVTTFLPCDLKEAEEDQVELCKILENKLQKLLSRSHDYKLAKYVLQWRECILKVEDGESDLIQFLPNVPLPDFGDFPTCLAKDVFLTKWLGIENVTKKINLDGYDESDVIKLEKEVRIMAQLDHPNIVKLFYCGSFKDSFGKNHLQFRMEKDPNGRPSFVKMYTSLMEIKKKDLKTRCTSKTLMRKDQPFLHFNLFTHLSSPIVTIGQWWLYIWRLIVYCLWAFIIDYIWRLFDSKWNDKCIEDISDSPILLKCRGLDLKMKTLETFLRNKSMVGVVGVSGIGKTTLVKALKDRLNKALPFNDSSKWTTIMCDLKSDYLMEMNQILKELGQKQEAKDLIEGKLILTSMLQQKKVLFILDDITAKCQLDMFLETEMFSMEGSKLIVIIRNWKILKGMIKEDSKFEVPMLNHDQSLEIFSKHAFKNKSSMIPHMNQLIKKIVEACGGHPLSLEVMGSCLNGQMRLRVWERALQRLKRGEYDAPEDVGRRLEISFDMLGDVEQEVFLDISCFFCKDVWFEEIREDTIVDYLDDNTKTILASLGDNSLIKIDANGFVSMHDSIRDMGRKISRTRFGGRRKWNQTLRSFETSKKEEFQNARGICITRMKKENGLNPIDKVARS